MYLSQTGLGHDHQPGLRPVCSVCLCLTSGSFRPVWVVSYCSIRIKICILDRSVCGECISINLFQTGLWSGLEFVLALDRSITEWRLEP